MEIEGRTADDFENFGSGGLLLQGIGQFGGTCLNFVEQTDVLDRDHRLVGERFHQIDLVFIERSDSLAHQQCYADWRSFPHERNAKHGAETHFLLHVEIFVVRIGKHVGNVYRLTLYQHASDRTASLPPQSNSLESVTDPRRESIACGPIVGVIPLANNGSHFRLAETSRRFRQRLQHQLQIEGRSADDFQHIRGSRLLLQQLGKIAQCAGAVR